METPTDGGRVFRTAHFWSGGSLADLLGDSGVFGQVTIGKMAGNSKLPAILEDTDHFINIRMERQCEKRIEELKVAHEIQMASFKEETMSLRSLLEKK